MSERYVTPLFYLEESLFEFVEKTISQASPVNKQFVLGPVPSHIVQQLAYENEFDLTDYVFTIDAYAIRHIMKSHGNEQKEAARGQKAITIDDFIEINAIITNPDVVFYDGKNRIGRDVIQFQKRIGNRYIILKEVRTGRKQLALNSMRIILAKKEPGLT